MPASSVVRKVIFPEIVLAQEASLLLEALVAHLAVDSEALVVVVDLEVSSCYIHYMSPVYLAATPVYLLCFNLQFLDVMIRLGKQVTLFVNTIITA